MSGFPMDRSASACCARVSPSLTPCSFPMTRAPGDGMRKPAGTGVQHLGGGPRVGAARWAARPERGSAWLLDVMMFVALRLGRPLAHRLLYPIAGYFYLFSPRARRYGREYLRRVLG